MIVPWHATMVAAGSCPCKVEKRMLACKNNMWRHDSCEKQPSLFILTTRKLAPVLQRSKRSTPSDP
jgi:hypothetical protein